MAMRSNSRPKPPGDTPAADSAASRRKRETGSPRFRAAARILREEVAGAWKESVGISVGFYRFREASRLTHSDHESLRAVEAIKALSASDRTIVEAIEAAARQHAASVVSSVVR